MADASYRSLNKVTYAPIRPSVEDERNGNIEKRQRGLEKIVFTNALRASGAEIDAIVAEIDPHTQDQLNKTLLTIRDATRRGGTARDKWTRLAALPAPLLVSAGRALAFHRKAERTKLREQAKKLTDDHAAFVRARIEMAVPSNDPESTSAPGFTTAGITGELGVLRKADTTNPRLTAASLKPSFAAALAWARVTDPERAESVTNMARNVVGVTGDTSNLTVMNWDKFTGSVVEGDDPPNWTDDLTDGFEERMKVEPIGRLHLERIDMTPAGVLRGELVHSVGLAPDETITLIHREWSSREVSFEKVVSEEFEQSTEEGVTENTELSSATETQARHASALSMEASASGSWGFASASATVGYNSTSDDEATKRDSRNHSIEVTRKSSSRTRKEHKTTFTVKEQAGVEDQSVRTLKNPSKTDPMRIDFHQMLRKWKVDLYRYGLRLTYDIVIPAPGIDLLANVDELRRIDHDLSQPFAFTLAPSEITRDSWQSLAARYGADVESPNPEVMSLSQQHTFPYQTDEAAKPARFDTIEVDIPDGYFIRQSSFRAYFSLYPDGHFDVMEDEGAAIGHNGPELRSYETALVQLIGRTGHIVVAIWSNGLVSGHAQATIEVMQSAEGWSAWQNRAWAAMRKGAEELWQLHRQDLQQRRDRLQEEIDRWDPLTLRRMEREEVMKTTLKWIFGPAFDLMPSEVARLYGGDSGGLQTLDPSRLTAEQWAQTMGLGEFIKFLHQAIEWENVLFFIYPYFWDNPRNHSLKRFLNHPDSIHQAFLRGGAARVVLTVRPGFEDTFTRLFETGSIDGDLGDHPYLTIAEEIRNYANTNYPGIPGNDSNESPTEEEIEAAERGKLIAQWNEYTPISALDITVNTPLDELK